MNTNPSKQMERPDQETSPLEEVKRKIEILGKWFPASSEWDKLVNANRAARRRDLLFADSANFVDGQELVRRNVLEFLTRAAGPFHG